MILRKYPAMKEKVILIKQDKKGLVVLAGMEKYGVIGQMAI
jgi:hypothetical protein